MTTRPIDLFEMEEDNVPKVDFDLSTMLVNIDVGEMMLTRVLKILSLA